MFHSARLQLTAWYLTIIMVISVLFSLAIYYRINEEFVRFERISHEVSERQRIVIRYLPHNGPPPPRFALEEIQEARSRLIINLLLLNAAIFAIAGGAGYFLAGKTLRPIQDMVDEQKRFITDASHELRTPLTALRTEIEVSLRDKKLSLVEAKRLLHSNLEEVIHLQLLSDNLLALSVQQKNKQKHFTHVSFQSMMSNALKKVQPLADKKNITIIPAQTKSILFGDEASLTELLVILLDNAIKYSPPKSKVKVVAKTEGNDLHISIIDNGEGIAKADLPHIFDRFYRSDKARANGSSGGYGLGLSIAQKIVREHYGSIKATSKTGTTILVVLPRV